VETAMPTTFCSCSTKSLSLVSKSFANVLRANRPALAAVFAYVPTSQVLLGSDYPFGTSTDGIRGLEEYGLKPRRSGRQLSRQRRTPAPAAQI
jgi:hypothetical protein